MKKKKSKKIMSRLGPTLLLFFIALMFAIPMLWVLFASLDSTATLALSAPEDPSLQNFVNVLTDPTNMRSFLNSFLMAITTAVLTVLLACMIAYPLSRYQMKSKRKFMYTILFLTGLPITALIIPVFQMFLMFNWQDSLLYTALFMTASGLPYAIWMMKNFMDSIPVDLEEAAWVDGASSKQTLRKIILPLMIPGLFTVGIYTFTGAWGNFFVPFILIMSPEKIPASVQIYQFFGANGLVNYGELAAYSILYSLPPIIMYAIAQSFMSKGFAMGGSDK